MAAQAGLCLAWSETPEDMFCRVVAQLHFTLPCTLITFAIVLGKMCLYCRSFDIIINVFLLFHLISNESTLSNF